MRKLDPEAIGDAINDLMQFALIGLCLSVFFIAVQIGVEALK